MTEEKKFKRGFATRAIHGSDVAKGKHAPVSTPIYQTSAFDVKGVLKGEMVEPEFLYTRGGNPTTREFEQKMADLEHAERGFAFASGMGAITGTILALTKNGDEIITDNEIYGSSWSFFSHYIPNYGVKTHFIDLSDETLLEETINDKTRMIFFESPTNPTLKIVDITKIAAIAKEHNLLSVTDNTFATPYNQNPIDFGVNYVIHSCTKYVGGHGDALGGITLGSTKNLIKVMPSAIEFGSTLSPFNAWLFLRGLKTLEVRMERHNASGLKFAKFLESQDKIERVLYPGLPSHPQHELAKKQMRGFGGVVSFYLKKGMDVSNFIKNLEIPAYTVSLGDADTFIEDPAALSHSYIARKVRKAIGITKYMLRVSVGLENIEDLIDDFENALKQV